MKLKITDMCPDFRVDVTDDNDNPIIDSRTGESTTHFSYDFPLFIKWHGNIYAIAVVRPYHILNEDSARARND
jgi:hypothetical protein